MALEASAALIQSVVDRGSRSIQCTAFTPWLWRLMDTAMAIGRDDVHVLRLSNRSARYRARAALRFWGAMW